MDPATAHMIAQHWSAPLPPPAAIETYERLVPGAANRILEMAEREQSHQIAMEAYAIPAAIADNRRGHYMGWSLAILALGGAIGTSLQGVHPIVPVALVSLPVATIIQTIVRSRPGRGANRET